MEPIKVDFSGNGKKKSVKDVLIPPDKPGLKIGISLGVMVLTAILGFYFMLPAINLGDYKFYIYIFLVLGSYVAASFITSGAFKKPEFVPYVKRRSLIPVILAAVFGVGAVILFVLGVFGEYLARIYTEAKGRPQYVVSETNTR